MPIYILLTLAIILRFVPHLANVAPIGAIAIFGGLYLPKKWAIILPLAAMLISDFFIGFYNWKIMLAVYLGFAVYGLIALAIRKRKNPLLIASGTLLGSLCFFLLTNLAVWLFGTMYSHSLPGLFQCYVAALPFFRNTLAGDLAFTTALVGAYELARYFKLNDFKIRKLSWKKI